MRVPGIFWTPAGDAPARSFSLVAGGPFYRLVVGTHLSGPALVPVRRLIAAATLIAWIPPLILTLREGSFAAGPHIPFLYDLEVHTRLLVAVPILIAAENFVHRIMRAVVRQFVDRNIVAAADRGRFYDLIESAMRLRNSKAIEAVMLVAAIALGSWVWERVSVPGQSTWFADASGRLTGAGFWYGFVSLPIARFLLLRWYFRLSVWYGFLLRVRSMPLHLKLFHPDRAAGLGFLAETVTAFTPVLLAQSVAMAGMVGNRIWHAGMNLLAFKMEILGVVVFLMLTVLAPLFMFTDRLFAARRIAEIEFGTLGSRYVDEFRAK